MTFARLKLTCILFLFVCLAFYLVSCGSILRSAPGFGFLDPDPTDRHQGVVNKVGLMPLRNMTAYQDANILKPLESKLFDRLTATCTGAIFIRSSDPSAPAFLTTPPRTPAGLIDGMDMALRCRQHGINMVLQASVTDIHYEKERSWYNWLIKDDDTIFLNIRVELFDTHTGTKIFHDTFMEEREFGPLDNESMIIPEIMALPDFEKLSNKLLKSLVKDICQTIQTTPWKGYILSADGAKGVISSGSDVGIKQNDVIRVYKNSGVMTGFGGIQYIIPGKIAGQVRVTGVTKNRADIMSSSGEKLSADMVVQY